MPIVNPPGATSAAPPPTTINPGTYNANQAAAGQAQTLNGLFGPQLAMSQAGYQQQYDALQNQLATYGQSTGYQEGLVGQDFNQQMQQYGLQGAGIQLSQDSLAYQQQLAGQEYGIQQQQFGLQDQALQQQYAVQQGQIGLQSQSLDQQLAQALYGFGQGSQQLTEGTTGAGTLNTGTFRQGAANLATQLGFQEQGINTARGQLNLSATSAADAYANSQAQLGLSEQSSAAQRFNQQQQFGLQSQQLQNSLKSLGLSEANAKTKADQAIAQLGLQGQISSDQVLNQLGALQQGQASTLTGVLPQIIALMQQPTPGGFGG